MSVNDVGGEWKPIDLSTTYFMPLKATKKQKLFELFVEKIEQYDHEDGHGFRRLTKEELPINASKKIIVMVYELLAC